MENDRYIGERFLSMLYKDMHTALTVEKSSNPNDSKLEKIRKYLERLQRIEERSKKEDRVELLKEFYYDKYVIKESQIPESYYIHQARVAKNLGHGDITITPELKKEYARILIKDQKESLDTWLDYLMGEDTDMYPYWAKYWAFQGMVQLGDYDKDKKMYFKRTEGTVTLFPDLNRGVLSLCMNQIIKYFVNKETIEEEIRSLVVSGSFKRLYEYYINKMEMFPKYKKVTNDGIWVKYPKGSDHMKLVNSIKEYNTKWCTEGEETAKYQLSNGDFYVYYSYNEEGNPVIPRIAIRMEGYNIAEVRGTSGNDQNLEGGLEEILEKKLEEFPDKEKYKKKVSDMKKLTLIYKKWENKGELTTEELRFLYEIDEFIIGFGFKKDPRIKEITNTRNKRQDLSKALNLKEDQISLTTEEFLKGTDIIYHDGDLDLSGLTSAKGIKFPKLIKGSLDLSRLATIEDLDLLNTIINGDLFLNGLTTAEGLDLSNTTINRSLYLYGLTTAKGVKFPEIIHGDLDLRNLTIAEGLDLSNTTINGFLNLYSLTTAESLDLSNTTINGGVNLSGLIQIKELKLPKIIKGSVILGLVMGSLDLSNTTITGNLDLSRLETIEDLDLSNTTINGDLYLPNLTTAKGLDLSNTIIKGKLFLNGLTTAEGLDLSNTTINRNLVLFSLTTAEGLKLPRTIKGILNIPKLKSVKGIIFPEGFDESIFNRIFCDKDILIQLKEEYYRQWGIKIEEQKTR